MHVKVLQYYSTCIHIDVLGINLDLLTFLEIGDPDFVLRVLLVAELAGLWQAVGQTLTILDSDLNSVNKQFRGDSNLCLLHTMAAWLNGRKRLADPPSWWRVVWAIADPLGGDMPRVAASIAAKFKGKLSVITINSHYSHVCIVDKF